MGLKFQAVMEQSACMTVRRSSVAIRTSTRIAFGAEQPLRVRVPVKGIMRRCHTLNVAMGMCVFGVSRNSVAKGNELLYVQLASLNDILDTK